MLSSKTKYALRAILRLAENAPSAIWLQTNEVAEQEQVPAPVPAAPSGDSAKKTTVPVKKPAGGSGKP